MANLWIWQNGRRCLQDPIQGEYSLCGDAFDTCGVDEGMERAEAFEGEGTVNCRHCVRIIQSVKDLSRWKTRGLLLGRQDES